MPFDSMPRRGAEGCPPDQLPAGDLDGLEDLLGEWSEEELRLWAAFHRDHHGGSPVPPSYRPEIVN